MAELPKIVRQKLRRSGAGLNPAGALEAGEHPDANLLAAFVEQSLNRKERQVVMSHLADCADCRDCVALAFPPNVETPLAEAVSSTESKPAWLSWPAWLPWQRLRWGTLAAALGTAFIVVLRYHPAPQAKREMSIAENKPLSTPAAPAQPQPKPEIASAEHPELGDKVGRYRPEGKTESAKRQNLSTSQSHTRAGNTPAVERGSEAASASEFAKVDRFREEDARRGGSRPLPIPPGTTPVHGANMTPPLPPAAATPPGIAGEVSPETSAPKPNLNSRPESTHTEVKSADIALNKETAAPAASKADGYAGANSADALRAVPQSPRANGEKAQVRSPAPLSSALPSAGVELPSSKARWTISSSYSLSGASAGPPLGKIERSLDGGRTWKEVRVDASISFRVVVANGPEVWAGGSRGALYHSTDGGEHWVRVNLTPDQAGLNDAIVGISFSDLKHGAVTNAAGEIWITSDAGQHWERR